MMEKVRCHAHLLSRRFYFFRPGDIRMFDEEHCARRVREFRIRLFLVGLGSHLKYDICLSRAARADVYFLPVYDDTTEKGGIT